MMQDGTQISRVAGMTHMNGLESISIQQLRHRLYGEIVQMSGWMNQAPFRPAQTRIQAANVARCQGQYALRKQVPCKFRDEEIGALEVLDRIPHHGDTEFARRVEREIVPLQRRDVENLARVSRPVSGNIDPARRAH